jgi:hypothetical protein
MPKGTMIEVRQADDWKRISVDEGLARNELRGRCIECNQPVRIHRPAANGQFAAHVEHLKRNPGCSLSDQR